MTVSERPSPGPLLGYARYQLRDAVVQRLLLPLVVVTLFAALPAYMMTKNTPPGFMQGAQGINLARQMFAQSVTLFLPMGAFLCAVGVISTDRHQGYIRFLFSKPVNVLALYAQAYVVAGVAFVLMFGFITWAFGTMTVHFSVHRAMEAAALTYVLIGGIGLLLGVITRFDGMTLILVYVLALLLQQLMAARNGLPDGGLPGWLATIARALPPVHKLDDLRDHLYAAQPLDMAQLWHVLGYGGGAAILAFVLMRRLPLAR
jgi:ABC-type multidrug transport system permease subunit